jgi:hypothetical protein
MAIAIEQDQAVEQEQVIRVDIRQLAAAATLLSQGPAQVSPRHCSVARERASAWRVHVWR